MPRTKTDSAASRGDAVSTTDTSATPQTDEVLTLAEAASYLRVSEQMLRSMVGQADFPGRIIGSEWRFLKSALHDWLRALPKPSSKEALSALAGAWKDDPYAKEMLKEIYKQRGRPMTEDGE